MKRVFLLSAVLLSVAAQAQPCRTGDCMNPRAVPATDRSAPSNAPALVIDPGYNSSADAGMLADPNVQLTLAGDGGYVEARVDQLGNVLVVKPRGGLVAGERYRLSTERSTCGSTATTESSFVAGPTAPVPLTLGTLTASAPVRRKLDAVPSEFCSAPRDLAYVTLSLSPSAEATPWLPLMRMQLTVNGQPWTTTRYGAFLGDRFECSEDASGRQIDLVSLDCSESATTGPVLPSGANVVVLKAEIPGRTEILNAQAEFTLSCDGLALGPPGTAASPAEACALREPPANPDDEGGSTGGKKKKDSGCSQAGAGSAQTASWLGVTVLLSVWALQRRRERR